MRSFDPLSRPILGGLRGDVLQVWSHRPVIGHVRTCGAFPTNLVAPCTTIFGDPVVTSLELLGLRNVSHLSVTFYAGAFGEAGWKHWEIPVMHFLPVVLLFPLMLFMKVGRLVRRIGEICTRTLSTVTHGTTEFVDRVRSVSIQI